jgi:hypothetical protein
VAPVQGEVARTRSAEHTGEDPRRQPAGGGPRSWFAVWAQSAAGTWYIGKIVSRNATTAYATSVTLAVPSARGYRIRVGYRPTAGSGTWTVYGLSGGSFTVN